MINKDIEDLVLQAKLGNKQALQEVIERFRPFVIKTAMGIFISGMEMEDLIQEGYISIIRVIDKFDIGKNSCFTAYVKSAVINNYNYAIISKLRKLIL
jgi:RNA polymerase sporulation-specific sigma factor